MPDSQYADPKEAFAYHAAGFAGLGGSSYIDSVIMREKDANTAWTSASDGTLEERVYYVQNWRSDVVALLDAVGNPLEEIRYSAYGTPSVHPIADVNHDGLVNSTDQTVWGDLFNEIPSTGVYAHNNLNRDELFPGDSDDDSFFSARYTATSGGAYGFNKLSSLGNRKGYAGYEWDVSATVWHVRHRVLDSASGKWTRMDLLGYVDGVDLFEYVSSLGLNATDPLGLCNFSWRNWGCYGDIARLTARVLVWLVEIGACIALLSTPAGPAAAIACAALIVSELCGIMVDILKAIEKCCPGSLDPQILPDLNALGDFCNTLSAVNLIANHKLFLKLLKKVGDWLMSGIYSKAMLTISNNTQVMTVDSFRQPLAQSARQGHWKGVQQKNVLSHHYSSW